MKFRITSTEIYSDSIIQAYPCLNDYAFEVEEVAFPSRSRIRDENGRPMYQSFTQIVRTPYIHINTIEDLIRLATDVNNELIIDKSGVIEIYDGYRE